MPRGGLDDAEGATVPPGLAVFDSHVHLFPAGVFEAIWRWFDANAWPVRYRLHAEEVIAFMKARGVKRFCALHYAHKPGIAAGLNRFVWALSRSHPEIVPLATVYPGEPDAQAVIEYALGELGMRGVKLHCHVQRMAADDPRLEFVYRHCTMAQVPVVIHAGREPSSSAYGVDTRALCAAAQIERVLRRHPRLNVVVPHLGADEFDDYARLLGQYGNLWLDTTMAIADYFPGAAPASLFPGMADRMLYGTDFPNLPYAWDRELHRLVAAVPDEAVQRKVLYDNAARLFGD
ncbi:MAG: amidohydrolase [Myxococcales bacterium]|nr:amidohydrolase [Myxococcales bacterium]